MCVWTWESVKMNLAGLAPAWQGAVSDVGLEKGKRRIPSHPKAISNHRKLCFSLLFISVLLCTLQSFIYISLFLNRSFQSHSLISKDSLCVFRSCLQTVEDVVFCFCFFKSHYGRTALSEQFSLLCFPD